MKPDVEEKPSEIPRVEIPRLDAPPRIDMPPSSLGPPASLGPPPSLPERPTMLWVRRGTVLAGLLPRTLPMARRKRVPRLVLEGAIAAAVSLVFASGADASQAAVISIFLTPAALVQRFDGLLEENRKLIWQGNPRNANINTAISILALFMGVFAVYALAVGFLPTTRVTEVIEVVARVARIGQDTILTRRFGSFLGLLAYNTGVLLTLSVVFANFVADLLYFKLDPRIKE